MRPSGSSDWGVAPDVASLRPESKYGDAQAAASSRNRCEVIGGLGGAPGLRPECECVSTVSTKGMTLRAEGWPASSGRRAVAVLSPNPISLRRAGRSSDPRSPVRPSIPLDPAARLRTPGRFPDRSAPAPRWDLTIAPVPSAPAAARSQARRALHATRRAHYGAV